ncbi:MAG: hypothetical protein K8Q99_03540 [Acholeplasmataceae bacterium]|nr:hypothetical protein [Acholeplasmataceae bacterium]
MNTRKFLKTVSYVLTGITFIFSIVTLVFGTFLLSFAQDYDDFDDYQTYIIIIDSITFNEDSIYITSTENRSYFLDDQNFIEVMNHDIQSNVQINDQVTIIVGKKGWGDSWDYPIVMIEKENTVYLDYETGISSINDQVARLEKEFIKSLILPISLFLITGGFSLYFFFTRKK